MKKILIIFCFISLLFISATVQCQKYVSVLAETKTVNSRTNSTGWTRNFVEVELPAGTIGYVYRISVFNKGGASVSNSLFSLLKAIPVSEISITASVAQYAISNNDGQQVDFFILKTAADVNNFYQKKDNNWSPCKSSPNMVNTCRYTTDCLGKKIWFCFRNNNIKQGLDVYVEVVAIVN